MGLLIALVAAAPVAAAQISQTYFFYNRWNPGGPAFWGNLTFSGEQGGISWAENPASEDGPADATNANLYAQDGTSKYYTGSSSVPVEPRRYEFVSAPLPQTLYLNASQNIQLELLLSDAGNANPCPYSYSSNVNDPNLEVRLTANGKIVGGQMADDSHYTYISWWWFGPPYTGPAPPSGWTLCRLAFASEAHMLQEGTVLRLEVWFKDQDRPYQVGASGEHRSRIKFNLLPPEEVLFRFPEFAPPEDEASQDEGGSAAVAGSAGAAVLGLVAAGLALPRRPRRALPLTLTFLLVAMAMGGCIATRAKDAGSGSQETLEGGIHNTLLRADGGLASGGLGSIVGRVNDDLHIPVGGVHVSILGMANFTATDGKGRFQFLNVVPGVYKLRFDKQEYKSFEADVEVKSGYVSRPQVTMVFANAKARDARPHSHDYWGDGRTTKELMNAPLATTCSTANSARCDFTGIVRIPPKEGQPNTVLPGTRNVQIVLDWDPASVGWERLGIALRHNGDAYAWNHSVYAPRGPGVPFEIATTWEMADPGHLLYSTWEITVYKGETYTKNGYVDAWTSYANTNRPAITMRAAITKGALPLEPGHPERWGTNTKLDIVKGGPSYWYNCATPKQAEPTVRCYDAWRARVYPQKVVPQGTAELEVKANWNRAPTFAVKLWMKPGDVPPPSDYYSLAGFQDRGTGSTSGTTTTWKVKLKPEEADFEYAKSTGFQFVLEAASYDEAYADYAVSLSNLGAVQPYLSLTASIVATKA